MSDQIKASPKDVIIKGLNALMGKDFDENHSGYDLRLLSLEEQLLNETNWVACLVILEGAGTGHRILLDKDETSLGRSNEADVCLAQHKVSRMHAVIQRLNDQQYVLIDKDSTNGTYLNSKPIKRVLLKNHDLIGIGEFKIKFIASDSPDQSYYEELYRQTHMDRLLLVYNKFFFIHRLGEEINRCRRYDTPLSLVVFDVDYFKRLVDQYGYLAGDAALVHLVSIVRSRIRDTDIFCRYGEEKFALILPHIGQKQALVLAENIRLLVSKKPVDHANLSIPMTISLGIASYFSNASQSCTKELIVAHADNALYQAKQCGRNRVVVFSSVT